MRSVTTLLFLFLSGSFAAAAPVGAAQAQQLPSTPLPSGQQPATTVSSRDQQTPPPSGRAAQNLLEVTLPPRAPALPTLTANVKLDLTITDTYTVRR
jgi:hypothetical protein